MKCGDNVQSNGTGIANNDYPLATNTSSECRIKVSIGQGGIALASNVHFVRVELESLELAPPNDDGVCVSTPRVLVFEL